jgi:hypothetical protein
MWRQLAIILLTVCLTCGCASTRYGLVDRQLDKNGREYHIEKDWYRTSKEVGKIAAWILVNYIMAQSIEED